MNRAAPGEPAGSPGAPSGRPAAYRELIVWAVSAYTVAWQAAFRLWNLCRGDGLPMWDPAEHGVAGVALSHALKHGDLIGLLLGINRQVLWPFAHSLMLLPWTLVLGADPVTAARLSAVLFVVAAVALVVAGAGLHPTRGPWVGLAAAALMLVSPIVRVFGSLCMLEMPGAMLLAITAALHIHACRETASQRLLIAAGVSSAALFFCKYNYGLLWLAPLALHEWRALPAERRTAIVARAGSWLAARRWLRPFPIFLALCAAAIAAIVVTGGGVFTVLGQKVSVRSPGNPLYGLYLVSLVAAALAVRRAGGLRAVSARLSPRHRIFAATILAPIAVWFLIPEPNRFGTFFGFVVNRDTAPPWLSLANWLDYPRVFAHDYSPVPWVGWIALALALVPPMRPAAGRDPRVLIYLAMWVGLLATSAHRYHQPRFLFTVAPLIWLSAASNVVTWLDRMLAPWSRREMAWGAVYTGLLVWMVFGGPPEAETRAARSRLISPLPLAPVVDRVLDLSAQSDRTPWLLGYANAMSPALVRWRGLLTHPELAEHRLPGGAPRLGPEAGDQAIDARIDMLRASGRPVIAALATRRFPDDGEYRDETHADFVTAVRLAADPRVVQESQEVFEEAGFRIAVYRFKAPDEPR